MDGLGNWVLQKLTTVSGDDKVLGRMGCLEGKGRHGFCLVGVAVLERAEKQRDGLLLEATTDMVSFCFPSLVVFFFFSDCFWRGKMRNLRGRKGKEEGPSSEREV